MFFSLDGLDGAGKTTQIELFCQWLIEQKRDVLRCHDPGSTAAGDAIRDILLSGRIAPIGRRAEMLLYMAARAQLVDEVIAPALAAGRTVVSDRYLLANVVYQGHAGGLDVPTLWQIGGVATNHLEPDLTVVLDMAPEAARARINRPLDRMELNDDAFFAALREGFRREAVRRPERIVMVDAARSIDEIQRDIRAAAERVMRSQMSSRHEGPR